MERVLEIEGMTCEHCKKAVEKMIAENGGIAVEVNLVEKKAHFDAGQGETEKIIEAINDSGIYKVKS